MPNDNIATVTSTGSSKVPTLSAGELSIEVFLHWRNMVEDYFEVKELDDADDKKRITHAMTGVQNMLMRDWYQNDRDRIKALKWTEFLKEFRDRWLPPHWEQKTRKLLTCARQGSSDAFKDWIVRVETINSYLVGTPSHKDEAQFRAHIESVLCDRLTQLAEAADVTSIVSYKSWKDKLTSLDDERLANMTELLRLAGKMNLARNTSSGTSGQGSSANANRRPTRDREYPPNLTSAERTLLARHGGCFKCRKFYAGHRQPECDQPPPKAAGYKELTEEDAAKAKKERDSKVPVKKETTAAVRLDSEVEANTAAAVRADSPVACGWLGYGTDSDYSGCVAASSHEPTLSAIPSCSPSSTAKPSSKPLTVPHFSLRAVVHDSCGPCVESPLRMLIDCGSSTVLIRSDVVKRLGLKLRALPSAIALNSAWGSKGTTTDSFVKLRISVLSLAWSSVSVKALVVDSLCAPVILGQPFLALNNLVLDCAARTCVDKSQNFDLLNPVKHTPLKEVVQVSPVREALKARRIAVKRALSPSTRPSLPRPSCETIIDDEFYCIRNAPLDDSLDYPIERIAPEDIARDYGTVPYHDDEIDHRPTIAAIRTTIESLAIQESFAKEEERMRARYADVFPSGTPKLSDLPTDVYHRFRLKNPDLVIARRSYDCPKK